MKEETKSASMNQKTAIFLVGAVGLFALTIFLIRKLDNE